jgi:hypothetical protein
MFRIRLASGEELLFGSVADLAQGIRAGRVPGNAEIYHRMSQRWLPISAHPAWDEAAPPSELGGPSSGSLAPPRSGEPVWGKTVKIYQMYSQSGREIAERRRPTWLAPVASLSAAVALVTALAFVMAPGSRIPDGSVRPTTGTGRTNAPTSSPAFTTSATRTWPDAPYDLARRMTQVADSAERALADSARRWGMAALLAPGRLGSADSVRSGRHAVIAFRRHLAAYRAGRQALVSAYADSSEMLVNAGTWSPTDLREWQVRSIRVESAPEAARTDSILSNLDRLFGLLIDQAGGYTWSPEAMRFRVPEAAEGYDRLRLRLRQLVTPPDPYSERPSPPLALLLPAVADSIPPAAFIGP